MPHSRRLNSMAGTSTPYKPGGEVSLVSYLFSTVLDGRNSSLRNGTERALGRPPRDFADYARETAKTGIWSR